MTTTRTLTIIGASVAGAKAAEAARNAGFDGRVVLIGDERELPYERPPKAVLRGEKAPETARVHDGAFYAANDINLLAGRRVVGIDPNERQVRLDSDQMLPYTTAVLATGAAPRHIDIPGAGLAGIHYLRTGGDAVRVGDAIRNAHRVAVIGRRLDRGRRSLRPHGK